MHTCTTIIRKLSLKELSYICQVNRTVKNVSTLLQTPIVTNKLKQKWTNTTTALDTFQNDERTEFVTK